MLSLWSIRFRKELLRRKLTLTQAAEALGAGVSSVWAWFHGKRLPRGRMLARIEQWSKGRVRAGLTLRKPQRLAA